jgi:hypothetical protein
MNNHPRIEILNENVVVDTFIVYQFLRKLVTPFNQWPAFRYGIIDRDGNVKRKRNTLKTQQEKNSFTLFDLLVLKIKRVLERLPYGKSKMASYAAALYFIKESQHFDENHYINDEDLFIECIEDFIEEFKKNPKNSEMFDEITRSKYLEEVPTNNIGSGHIAGVKDPVKVNRRPPLVRRRKNEKDD